ncbi:hypothetical protein CFOL_v3_07250 [Cephalotus follicularis]|uniref:DUF7653 domain-containing protein n=1 Tax=Cephalotus follicularis TaxID=3775 RepID=A0A1Q3B7H6_CEPFO|nr:hypothetical protein CFOL_v3_07250 [Cephalotus follicularis]
MKKLFSFISSSSNNGNENAVVPPTTDKQVYWESPSDGGAKNQSGSKAENNFRSPRGLFSKSRKQIHDSQSSSSNSGLRRSRSLSSAAFLVDGLGQSNVSCASDYNRTPCSSFSRVQLQQHDPSSRTRTATPERRCRVKRSEVVQSKHAIERPRDDSSGNSSFSSSNVSTKVLDRYIDGEQQEETNRPKSNSQRNNTGIRNVKEQLPPRSQYTAYTSPIDSVKNKPRARSFREGTRLHFSSRDWVENEFGHESPQRLAKNVIERLSHIHALPKSNLESDHDTPITIEDIYGGSLSRCSDSIPDVIPENSASLDEPYGVVNGYHRDGLSSFQKRSCFIGKHSNDLNSVETGEDRDVELNRRSKEAEKRFMLFSEELEQERFLLDCGFDMSSLVQTIKNLTEERVSLALEISGLLQSRIAERASANEELGLAKEELESRTRRLEKEKNEMQSALEKELDRRSSDWSFKLEKFQLEESRLRERVRELAEHNVALQRDVSSFSGREKEFKDQTTRVEQTSEENQYLRQNLFEIQEKYRAAEEDLDCLKRNFEEKDKECRELQKSISSLVKTCSEQVKTIEGLREGFGEEIAKNHSPEESEKYVAKLQREQMRLTGIELALRREVESYGLQVDSLRHENIDLLNRLKGNGKDSGVVTFKLDREMWARTYCLQNQGLYMLKESTRFCSKLLEFIKGRAGQLSEAKQGAEFIKNGLDGQFFVESDMKLQGFKRGTESLSRSLEKMSFLLNEKSNPVAQESPTPCIDADGSGKLNNPTPEQIIRSELKAETLLTSLLKEKIYSKELEAEQLQAEVAAAVRGNDLLKCEVQNAWDELSCVTHKLKELEILMLKKDESISQLENNLQENTKELTIMRGILPKVSEERDLMWEEVKRYNENNMLLNSEINQLKKKIEALDEDILLKEGQITILKDTLGRKPFDFLAINDSTRDYLLE